MDITSVGKGLFKERKRAECSNDGEETTYFKGSPELSLLLNLNLNLNLNQSADLTIRGGFLRGRNNAEIRQLPYHDHYPVMQPSFIFTDHGS